MNKGKEKCNALKEIRKNIATKLGVDLQQRECTYQGECTGTCPRCQKEEEILNKKLLQKTAIVGGIAAMSLSITGCGLFSNNNLTGDVEITPPNKDELSSNPDVAGLMEEPMQIETPKDIESKIEDINNIKNENENVEEPFQLTGDVEYIGN